MSLNLWKLAGKPTSYNPLPTGGNNYMSVSVMNDYVLRIKAFSPTNAIINIADSGFASINKDIILTNVSTLYEINFFKKLSGSNNLFLQDKNNKGDIIIESIELVQKPLPKLTINGVDGFLSGKWTLHANARVVDDETLVLDATASYQASTLSVDLLPNTTYTFNGYRSGRYSLDYYNGNSFLSNAFVDLSNTDGEKVVSFTTPANCNKVIVNLTNLNTGQFTFKRPMLNLGTSPAPYEKKRGERMVLPVAKKNLIHTQDINFWQFRSNVSGTVLMDGSILANTTSDKNALRYVFPVKKGKTYSISWYVKKGTISGLKYCLYDLDNFSDIIGLTDYPSAFTSGDFVSQSLFYTATKDGSIGFYPIRDTNVVGSVYFKDFQIEEGTVSTRYEPYVVQINKKPQKYVPKKNLFDGVLESGSIDTANGVNIVLGTTTRSVYFSPVKSNTVYTLSNSLNISNVNVYFYDVNKNFISYVNSLNFTTPSNTYFVKFRIVSTDLTNKVQIEEGTQATTFEPYQLVLPKAKTGLSFNGLTDYLQLPSMTMDSIEIDCLIDSVQPSGISQILVDFRYGLSNGYVYASEQSVGTNVLTVVSGSQMLRNVRQVIKINSSVPITDDPTIFANVIFGGKTKGTLYKVTCYLRGEIVAQYDFENRQNIAGDKVIPNAKNLIPNFEDGRWSLHANAKVFGRDVLRLDGSGNYNSSTISINVRPYTNYLFDCTGDSLITDKSTNVVLTNGLYTSGARSFNSGSNSEVIVWLSNNSKGTGTFTFIKPQLYELSGSEGTLVGTPITRQRKSRRTLYAKR